MRIDLSDTALGKTEPIQNDEPIQGALLTGLDPHFGATLVGTVVVDSYDEVVVDGAEGSHGVPGASQTQHSHLDSVTHRWRCERGGSPRTTGWVVTGARWPPFARLL